jgi:predicted esterase
MTPTDPHAGQPVRRLGPEPPSGRLAAILVHGRGGSARDMLGLAAALDVDDVTYLAPQAANQTWYPYSFLAPMDRNEPGLSSGLGVLARLVETLGSQGVSLDRVVLLGFSQGACLTLEFAARHARRYAAIIGLSGGLIGPDGSPRDYKGSLDGTPVFLGCSDVDPHVPLGRVHETRDVMRRLSGLVDERIYPGMPHTVNDDEIEAIRALIAPRSS